MTPSTPSPLAMTDLLSLGVKYRRWICTGTFLSAALFTAAALVLPQRFKSYFLLTIHSNYFQNPLTRDLTPDIYDSAEMRSQRESLIRQSLTPDFIDMLGEKYGFYRTAQPKFVQTFLDLFPIKQNTGDASVKLWVRSIQRRRLMSRITIINVNNDTFQVGVIAASPETAYRAGQDIYARVLRGLNEGRRSNLVSLRGAIQKNLASLASSLPPPVDPAHPTTPMAVDPQAYSGPTKVGDELAEVRSELHVMSVRYTDEHPRVKELRQREKTLMAMSRPEDPLSVRVPAEAAVEIYKDLNRKLNYLNISFESNPSSDIVTLESPTYPESPLWPTKSLIVLWGFGVGLLGSLFLAILREYFKRATLHAVDLSRELGIPLLGELPSIAWETAPASLRRN